MSDTRAAILRAVREHIDDDTPRLAFADYLDDAGEPERAEFVRVQVELARTFVRGVAGRGVNAHRKQLARVRQLLEWNERQRVWSGHDWWAGLPGEPALSEMGNCLVSQRSPAGIEYSPERGFVEAVTCPAADWLAAADAILASHPVRRVRLTTWPADAPGWPPNRNLVPGDPGEELWEYDRWPGVAFRMPLMPTNFGAAAAQAAEAFRGIAAAAEPAVRRLNQAMTTFAEQTARVLTPVAAALGGARRPPPAELVAGAEPLPVEPDAPTA